jgi:hypothetical protein
VVELVLQVNPSLKEGGRARPRTYTLLLFGLLKCTEVWYRSTGPFGPDEMAAMIHALFLHGLPAAPRHGK